ncbi:flavin reductase family protein [Ketogulonicigenium vulgare]|uniref:flavin reductase family protein n=1 Tax=Ketogulonicigenium vulgare TaxID=92945 RepID=UPI0023594271|nr:flavin reductase family protein [Ketogulonicigenium vulgare]
MFYTPEAGHSLPHSPLTAIVAPRPIGWISSRGADGRDNLAPYSYFNLVASAPAQVMFSSTAQKADRGDTKDSVGNIRETGVFCANIVSEALLGAMNLSAANWPRDIDEFEAAGLAKADCQTINCPRVADAPASLECVVSQIITLEGAHNFMVIGRITGVHIADTCLDANGAFDPRLFGQASRLGYADYAVVRDTFAMPRPQRIG